MRKKSVDTKVGNPRRIVLGQDVRFLPEGAILDLPPDAILTDIAREWIEKKKLRIVEIRESPASVPGKVRIAIGADHVCWEMKEAVKQLLEKMGAAYIDFSAHSTQTVEYPDSAHAVALAVTLGQAELGIVIDSTGIGSSIVANKVPGIRAAACHDEETARYCREQNDANLLALGGKLISREAMVKVVQAFLLATLGEGPHRSSVQQIMEIERKYYRPF